MNTSSRSLSFLIALALAVACGTAAIVATYSRLSHTWDEGIHLAAGLELLQDGRYTFQTENPPLARVVNALIPYARGARLPAPGRREPWIQVAGDSAFYGTPGACRPRYLCAMGILTRVYRYAIHRVAMATMNPSIKRGSAELAVLAVLEQQPLHGYEIARRIEQESDGALRFTLASLYPLLYRMEKRGWTKATWETTPAGVRRRCYGLTARGVRQLGATRREWDAFFHALSRIGGLRRA
jgi:PadR family transcriptional regulator PadR